MVGEPYIFGHGGNLRFTSGVHECMIVSHGWVYPSASVRGMRFRAGRRETERLDCRAPQYFCFSIVAQSSRGSGRDELHSTACDAASRTTGWLVPTTMTRARDAHHRAALLARKGDFYFLRSEFWTVLNLCRSGIAIRFGSFHNWGLGARPVLQCRAFSCQ